MAKTTKRAPSKEIVKKKCGIVMPISAFDIYTEQHWEDVKRIISEAATSIGFEPNLVSYADESSVIHKTIINNLYDNEIVIVDVSGKNPNVMFELGIRLAFDKPTIIIKDNKTNYVFDASIIDHVPYPFDLHYYSIEDFKKKLAAKIDATFKKPNSFLKNFGEFTVSKLTKKAIPEQQYILKAIQELQNDFNSFKTKSNKPSNTPNNSSLTSRRQRIYTLWSKYMDKQGKKVSPKIMASDFVQFKKWMLAHYPKTSILNGIETMEATYLQQIIIENNSMQSGFDYIFH